MSKRYNLIGQRFGKLTVIENLGLRKKNNHGAYYWLCKCDCGNTKEIKTADLMNGDYRSCGCNKGKAISEALRQDLTGQRFCRLTVVRLVENKRSLWLCKCDCGNETVVSAGHLKDGHTTSCGCLGREHLLQSVSKQNGMSNTRLYQIYRGMKQRCFNSNIKEYKYYGGRGITICDKWLGKDGFRNFLEWANANGYANNLTIERIDVNGNYEPSNCKWIPKEEQAINRRTTKYITAYGKTQSLSQWSKETGLSADLIRSRVFACGIDPEEALSSNEDRRYKHGKRICINK